MVPWIQVYFATRFTVQLLDITRVRPGYSIGPFRGFIPHPYSIETRVFKTVVVIELPRVFQ